jgi:putative protease
MPEQEIAKVIHYYDKIMVALLKLSSDLSVGETVKFVYQGKESSQTIDSMEINHGRIQSAKAGDEVAVKLSEPTHENAKVYKVS